MNAIKKTKFYGLQERGRQIIRYVGKTEGALKKRLTDHLRDAKLEGHTHKQNWIRSIVGSLEIILIEEFSFQESCEWEAREKYLISLFKAYGHDLTNTTVGGEGLGSGPDHPMFGRRHTIETRAIISAAGRRPCPPERRQKIGEAQQGEKNHRFGKINSEEMRAKVSFALAGKPFTIEHSAAISRAMLASDAHKKASLNKKGKPKSEQTRAKMCDAQLLRRARERRIAVPQQLQYLTPLMILC